MARLRSHSSLSAHWLGFSCAALLAACSSDHHRSAAPGASEEIDAVRTGSMAMPLTAHGASGALYRLRDAVFQVNDPLFTFFQTFFTENDPLATRLEATLPVGDFSITLFEGFSLERVEPDGSTTRVKTTLVSPSSQSFHIDTNQETLISYQFETNGEIVNFGQGRLVVDIDVTERAGEARRTVMETSRAALEGVSLRQTLDAALSNAGTRSVSSEDVYHALIDSYNEAPGFDPSLRHCDDQRTSGQPSINGFPLACPRAEGQQFDNLDAWFPLAFVNRLDLAPTDGQTCGQQRMIFANPFNGRMFIIVEAEIPNPDPECGVSACRPIAEFWDSLATVSDASERGSRLRDAFLSTGLRGGIGPFMDARHLGPQGGQIRTNNFNDFQWTLREFQLQPDPVVLPLPVSVSEAPNGELWNDTSRLAQGAACRDSFMTSIPNLLSDNLATLGFPVAEPCEDAESPNDFSRQDYASHLSSGSGEFASDIDRFLDGSGLSSSDIANRARFGGSCMGCHIESSGAFLGRGVFAPPSSDFVHVSEQATERCPEGGICFGISEALRSVFLPHRINVQRNFLATPVGCAAPEPEDPGSVDGGAPIVSARIATRRTLGGQPFTEHAH